MLEAIGALIVVLVGVAVWRYSSKRDLEQKEAIAEEFRELEDDELDELGIPKKLDGMVSRPALALFDDVEWWRDVWGPRQPDGAEPETSVYDWKADRELRRSIPVAGPGRGQAI